VLFCYNFRHTFVPYSPKLLFSTFVQLVNLWAVECGRVWVVNTCWRALVLNRRRCTVDCPTRDLRRAAIVNARFTAVLLAVTSLTATILGQSDVSDTPIVLCVESIRMPRADGCGPPGAADARNDGISSICPIHTDTPDTTQTGLFCRV